MLLPSEIGVASKFLVSIEVFFSSQVIQQKYGNNDLKLYQNSFDAFESHPPQLISPSLLFMNRNLANWMQINVALFLKGIEHDEIWAKYSGETLTNVKIFRFINERYWPPVSKNPKLQRNSTFFVQNSKFLIIFENYERKYPGKYGQIPATAQNELFRSNFNQANEHEHKDNENECQNYCWF